MPLAAAYAEAGQFADAVKLQQKALEDPVIPKDAKANAEKRLELYKSGKPYRDE